MNITDSEEEEDNDEVEEEEDDEDEDKEKKVEKMEEEEEDTDEEEDKEEVEEETGEDKEEIPDKEVEQKFLNEVLLESADRLPIRGGEPWQGDPADSILSPDQKKSAFKKVNDKKINEGSNSSTSNQKKTITLWNQYFCCFNAHAEPENPCSVETICFFGMPSYVDCGVLTVGKDLTSHLTDTFLVCVCRTY